MNKFIVWFNRRILKKIKQKHPIEVYHNGRLIVAGSATIHAEVDKPTTIVFDEVHQ